MLKFKSTGLQKSFAILFSLCFFHDYDDPYKMHCIAETVPTFMHAVIKSGIIIICHRIVPLEWVAC